MKSRSASAPALSDVWTSRLLPLGSFRSSAVIVEPKSVPCGGVSKSCANDGQPANWVRKVTL